MSRLNWTTLICFRPKFSKTRRKNRNNSSIVTVLILAGTALGQAGATQPSDPIASLIAQLNDPVFGVREQAEKALEQMGPSIEPQLRDAERANLPDETRARIDHIIGRFEEALALHASITLHYQDESVANILNDFANQAGSRLGIDDPAVVKFIQGRTASIDVDDVDFWQGLRAVSRATGLATAMGINGVVLATFPGRAGIGINIFNRYAVSSGGLLIMPLGMDELRRLDYNTGKSTEIMSLPIGVFAEPKLHIVGLMDPNWLKECVDDKGHSLISPIPNRRFFPGFMLQRGIRQWSWTLPANLHEVPDMGTEIARIRGELNFSAQTRGATLEIDDITNPQTASTRDGMATVTILNCAKTPPNYRLTIRFEGITQNAPEFLDFVDTARLVDDQGRVAPRQNYLPPRPGSLDVEVVFQPTDITPTKLLWDRTLEQKKFAIPFELDKLPLPGIH
jgi:hypothetical protein